MHRIRWPSGLDKEERDAVIGVATFLSLFVPIQLILWKLLGLTGGVAAQLGSVIAALIGFAILRRFYRA
jgi:hypothetical protein